MYFDCMQNYYLSLLRMISCSLTVNGVSLFILSRFPLEEKTALKHGSFILKFIYMIYIQLNKCCIPNLPMGLHKLSVHLQVVKKLLCLLGKSPLFLLLLFLGLLYFLALVDLDPSKC